MGDSDDDYNRRRGGRDKFPKERNDFQEKRRDFGGSGGVVDPERRGYGPQRMEYKSFQRRPGPGSSPPMKRMRRDWGDDGFEPRREVTEPGAVGNGAVSQSGGGLNASLMTFKQFLTTQDDSISDEDAISKYHDYKLEHKRQQMHNFFIAHKDEEWFRLKYHPDDSAKRKAEQLAGVQKRADVFQDLLNKGWLDKAIADHLNTRHIIKLMDAVVVKLEGGTDEDLAMLDKYADNDDGYCDEPLENLDRDDKDNEEHHPAPAARKARSRTVESNESNKKKRNSIGNEDGALSDSDGSEKGSVVSGKSKSSAPPSVEAGEVAADKDSPTPTPTKNEADDNATSPSGETAIKKGHSPRPRSPIPQKMMLHKTASIFLRNLAPTITKSEVEALCKRFPGFLRVALAEPIPDRKFYRRGWVSFRRDVAIKDICWNLNNIRLKDCEMGPIVNRDLLRRIRVANGNTTHKQVAQNDLRLAARLVQIYDKKFGLFQNDSANNDRAPGGDTLFSSEFNMCSKNPILKNITDYLIEEASAEEEELLGIANKSSEDGDHKVPLEKDDNVLKVLDRILLYLRIVHSLDFYNHGEYPNEDEMPNRCGLMHVRGPQYTAQVGADDKGLPLLEAKQIEEFCKTFEANLQPLLNIKDHINDDECEKLGKKDPEKEVEAFINANCQELAKDKWLCPLSGKKFKGPEFVRKHVLSKHGEKLDEVRLEVTYFNNFLYDPKRPGVPDMKSISSTPTSGPAPLANTDRPAYNYDRGSSDYYRSGGGGGNYHRNDNYGGGGYGSYGGGGYGGGFRRDNRDHYQRRDFGQQRRNNYGGGADAPAGGGRQNVSNEGIGRRDPRGLVAYTDLDAPEDVY